MEGSEQEIQAKQALLQSEIIDKNLDKGSFINFCLSKKENGDDLNNWTLQELEEIVKEFVESQTQSQPQTNQKGDNEDLNKENLEKMEKFNADEPKVFKEKTVNCRKLEKSQLNDKKITITVKNPKEMDGGVFGKNYVLYEVQTDPLGWVVTRRFSDFDTLRLLLVKYFPSYNIPPLPNKKMGNRRFNLNFIMKRMKFLNLFINNVVQSEDFKASEILIAFLSYTDRGKFELFCVNSFILCVLSSLLFFFIFFLILKVALSVKTFFIIFLGGFVRILLLSKFFKIDNFDFFLFFKFSWLFLLGELFVVKCFAKSFFILFISFIPSFKILLIFEE